MSGADIPAATRRPRGPVVESEVGLSIRRARSHLQESKPDALFERDRDRRWKPM